MTSPQTPGNGPHMKQETLTLAQLQWKDLDDRTSPGAPRDTSIQITALQRVKFSTKEGPQDRQPWHNEAA